MTEEKNEKKQKQKMTQDEAASGLAPRSTS